MDQPSWPPAPAGQDTTSEYDDILDRVRAGLKPHQASRPFICLTVALAREARLPRKQGIEVAKSYCARHGIPFKVWRWCRLSIAVAIIHREDMKNFRVDPKEIEHALRCIIGQPLSDMWRAGGWQCIEFGVQKEFINRRGEESSRADYSLHILCDWRIIGPEGILVGSADYGPGSERRDEQAHAFFKSLDTDPPNVQALTASSLGDLRISLTHGYTLEIMYFEHLEDDQWWFLPEHSSSYLLDGDGFGPVKSTSTEKEPITTAKNTGERTNAEQTPL